MDRISSKLLHGTLGPRIFPWSLLHIFIQLPCTSTHRILIQPQSCLLKVLWYIFATTIHSMWNVFPSTSLHLAGINCFMFMLSGSVAKPLNKVPPGLGFGTLPWNFPDGNWLVQSSASRLDLVSVSWVMARSPGKFFYSLSLGPNIILLCEAIPDLPSLIF